MKDFKGMGVEGILITLTLKDSVWFQESVWQ